MYISTYKYDFSGDEVKIVNFSKFSEKIAISFAILYLLNILVLSIYLASFSGDIFVASLAFFFIEISFVIPFFTGLRSIKWTFLQILVPIIAFFFLDKILPADYFNSNLFWIWYSFFLISSLMFSFILFGIKKLIIKIFNKKNEVKKTNDEQ